MHNNVKEFIAANRLHCSKSNACSEGNLRFEIVSGEKFTRIQIDKGVITSTQIEKCDFGFIKHSNDEFYFVELKGKKSDIQKAFSQLVSTINHFENNLIKIPQKQRLGFIVGGTAPKQSQTNRNLKLKFARDHGRLLKIESPVLKHIPD